MTSGSFGVSTALCFKAFVKIPEPADHRWDRLQHLPLLGKLAVLPLGAVPSSGVACGQQRKAGGCLQMSRQ